MSDQLRGRPLPVTDAVRYGIAVADALRHVHEQDGVYGSLDPDCIILTDDGVQLAPAQRRTVMSPYAAPEQLQGNYDDPRSDIFTLGAIVYEMLAGRRAFQNRKSEGLRTAILELEPEPIDDVPRPLEQLLRACLEKRPERRLQHAQIVVARLKLIAASLRIVGLPLEPPAELRHTQVKEAATNGHSRTESVTEPVIVEQEAIAVSAPVKKRRPCPKCKAADVRPSRPKGTMEAVLVKLGVELSRCHRCYHRFMQVAFLSVSRE